MTRLLVKGGAVFTMDPGERLCRDDVLVEDDAIVAVEPGIEVGAKAIDVRGTA
ncbi:hypothetical protein ACTMTI_19145 [Nonomuraea sp. H19]|uniref:hypothetical protein n=1 Tax=Nonomuraea sp. H19 TaxID=3452206 RepID=UPI003F887F98